MGEPPLALQNQRSAKHAVVSLHQYRVHPGRMAAQVNGVFSDTQHRSSLWIEYRALKDQLFVNANEELALRRVRSEGDAWCLIFFDHSQIYVAGSDRANIRPVLDRIVLRHADQCPAAGNASTCAGKEQAAGAPDTLYPISGRETRRTQTLDANAFAWRSVN